MSALTPAQAEILDRAIDALAGDLVDVTEDQAELYAQGGAMAVAEAAYLPGGPSREELAARYEALVNEARARQRTEAA